jgi:large subunit ribosomal protein L31
MAMKEGIHPEYRPVVFEDASAEFRFITKSTVKTNETTKWEDGNEYPLVRVEISSASHPFFTGRQKFVDTAGRVEKFQKRFGGDYFAKKGSGKKK